jgi:hypothetical protein
MLTLLLALRLLTAEVLDNAAIMMVSAGLGSDVIMLKIERSVGAFDTSTDGLIALKKAHVPDAVIRAVLVKGESASPVPPVSAAIATPVSRPAPAAAPASPATALRRRQCRYPRQPRFRRRQQRRLRCRHHRIRPPRSPLRRYPLARKTSVRT